MTAMTWEYEPEAYQFDYEPEDWPEFEPERAPRPMTGRRAPYRPTVGAPARRPQTYTPAQAPGGFATKAELTRALQRVAADIDGLKGGARTTTSQLNDLSQRTGRAFGNVRAEAQQQRQQVERGLSSTRELAVLSGLLGGSGGSAGLLILLLLAGEGTGTGPDGQPAPGGTFSGTNTSLLLALALSGALGN